MPTLPPINRGGSGSGSGRARTWAFMIVGALGLLGIAPASTARAQEPKGDAPAAKAEAPADDPAPKADAPVSTTAAPAGGVTPPAKKSLLWWFIEAAGPIGLCLVVLSVYMTALIIRLLMELRLTEAVPPPLVEKLESSIKERKFQEAYDACRDNESFLARLVRTGVANLPNGRPEAKEAMNGMAEEVVTGMEQKISYLAIIGQLGPLIGLVGTLIGMIMAFQEISNAAGAQPRPEKVAEGISTALVITLLGISLAVPAIFFFAFFRNRIAVMTLEATRVADRVINSLVAAAKQAKSA